MRILIGYSMRSGSTLLQHILGQHSAVQSYSDLNSLPALASAWLGLQPRGYRLIKPLDLFYLMPGTRLFNHFDRYVWLIRDPRDSYLSAIESGYAYLFWPPGKKEEGIDVGLLKRWKKIAARYLHNAHKWHLIRYEYLGYPGNYGCIPGTALPKELGGDGDPLDVLVLGQAVPRGEIVDVRLVGVLKMLDGGEQDDKLIGVLTKDSPFAHIETMSQIDREFPGVSQILDIWFANYKGPDGGMEGQGFDEAQTARAVLDAAAENFESSR